MPDIPKKEQDAAVKFEARRYLPFKLDEIRYDYRIFKDKREPKSMGVLFVAAKNEQVLRFAGIIEKAGRKAACIEVAPLAIARVFQTFENIHQMGVAAIAKIETGRLSIYVFKDGVPHLAQEASFEQDSANSFERLLNQLRLSFDYYARQFSGEPITKLFVTGEGALDGWDEKLHNELKVVAKVSRPLAAIDPKAALPQGALVALGAAMRGLPIKWPVLMNLSPVAYKPKKELVTVRNVVLAEAALIVFMIIIGNIISTRGVLRFKKEMNKLLSGIPASSVSRSLDQKEKIETYKYNLKSKFSFVDAAAGKRIYWTFKLSRLIDLLPEGVWLSDILAEDKLYDTGGIPPVRFERTLTIRGSAYKETEDSGIELVNRFVGSLKSDAKFSEGFSNIEVRSITKQETEGSQITRFELSCR